MVQITDHIREALTDLVERLGIEHKIPLYRIENTKALAQAFREEKYEIAEALGVKALDDMDYDDVLNFINKDGLSYYEREELTEAIGFDPGPHPLTEGSMIKEMKLELFAQMIDDVSMEDLEALFEKCRPGRVPVTQMSIAI